MKDLTFTSLLFLCFFSLPTYGQNTITDSLKNLVLTSPDDTNKVKHLVRIAINYYRKDREESLRYSGEAKRLSEKLGFEKGIVNASLEKVRVLTDLGKYKEGLEENAVALEAAESINYTSKLPAIYVNFSILYRCEGNTEMAARKYFLEALAITKQYKLEYEELIILTSLGYVEPDSLARLAYINRNIELSEQRRR